MMLRSSSTPVLGSLISSFTESPNNNHQYQSEFHGATQKHTVSSVHQNCSMLSRANGGSQNFRKFLLHSPSIAEIKSPDISSKNGFRRVQSEGNLEELADTSYSRGDEFSFSNQCFKKFARKPNNSTLEAIPSISFHKRRTGCEDVDSDEEETEEEDEGFEVKYGNPFRVENLVLEEAKTNNNDNGSLKLEGNEGKMYLAAGLGVTDISFIDGGEHGRGGGSGRSYRPVAFDRDGGDSHGVSMEAHYKRMLEENPGNPLVLRNYAQFLYQRKGDLKGAEEYYSRAILADPEDGEVLSQYAQLIWKFERDQERATNYFERAIQASSENSHIQAAYASFLWDVEDEDDEEDNTCVRPLLVQQGAMASATPFSNIMTFCSCLEVKASRVLVFNSKYDENNHAVDSLLLFMGKEIISLLPRDVESLKNPSNDTAD